MKKSLFIIIALFIASINIQAQINSKSTQDSIVFEKLINDYGTIVQGSDGNCVFNFTNIGKVPLIITNVRASCGCTTPEWPKKPLNPGESGVIKVLYNTKRLGRFNKSITVTSNAVNSTILLRIKGNVTAKQ